MGIFFCVFLYFLLVKKVQECCPAVVFSKMPYIIYILGDAMFSEGKAKGWRQGGSLGLQMTAQGTGVTADDNNPAARPVLS